MITVSSCGLSFNRLHSLVSSLELGRFGDLEEITLTILSFFHSFQLRSVMAVIVIAGVVIVGFTVFSCLRLRLHFHFHLRFLPICLFAYSRSCQQYDEHLSTNLITSGSYPVLRKKMFRERSAEDSVRPM